MVWGVLQNCVYSVTIKYFQKNEAHICDDVKDVLCSSSHAQMVPAASHALQYITHLQYI